jgi:hypothetical protein
MPDYQLAKIYKIVCNITGDIYIGSTCEPILARRLAGHVANYKSYLNGKCNNVTSFKIIANDDYDIVLIELFPCNSKDELHSRESHYTQTIQCVNRIKNQGLLNALGGKKSYNKFYSDQNKEPIKKQRKQYCKQKFNCQCGGFCGINHKTRHERTKKHKEYVENRLYYDIQRGLDIIKKLDAFFKNK